MAPSSFRIADGSVHVYRLFDVGDAVDLVAAERNVATSSRLRLEGTQSGAAIEIPRPPLHVHLGRRTLPLASGPRDVEARARVYDYGVVSIHFRLELAPGTPLDSLVPLSDELAATPTPRIDALARREAQELAAALGAALERPHEWDGFETYQVIFVRAMEEACDARALLTEAPLAELVLGETSAVPLSEGERADVLHSRFSYLADDLAVVDWNCAIVVEPSAVFDIPDLLEFATAQLLELRYYDALLDRELHQIYDELERGHASRNPFTSRHARLRNRTAALLVELNEMTERLENAVKIIGDFYLARVYQGAVRRFRLPAWQDAVLRKQRLLAGVHQLLNDASDTRRAELLELTIILLILWEILFALVR
ncbi:MAG TPA: hypothetical protein VFK85_02945 [Anaeromyxobacteraceae bacterium]|nr:hypothetical protein [Anaeromyxobacteraceae bacterium]